MTLDASVRGEVSVTMKGYVDDLLAAWEPAGTITSPADVGLFKIGPTEKCEESMRKESHPCSEITVSCQAYETRLPHDCVISRYEGEGMQQGGLGEIRQTDHVHRWNGRQSTEI